jgi:hypothetical protein
MSALDSIPSEKYSADPSANHSGSEKKLCRAISAAAEPPYIWSNIIACTISCTST